LLAKKRRYRKEDIRTERNFRKSWGAIGMNKQISLLIGIALIIAGVSVAIKPAMSKTVEGAITKPRSQMIGEAIF